MDKFCVYVRPSGTRDYAVISIGFRPGRNHAVLHKLLPQTQYEVEICAANMKGEGERTKATFTTLHSDGKPRIISCDSKEEHRRRINWGSVRNNLIAMLALGIFIFMFVFLIALSAESIICKRLVDNIQSHTAIDICSQEQRDFLHSQLNACNVEHSDEYHVPPSKLWLVIYQFFQGLSMHNEYNT